MNYSEFRQYSQVFQCIVCVFSRAHIFRATMSPPRRRRRRTRFGRRHARTSRTNAATCGRRFTSTNRCCGDIVVVPVVKAKVRATSGREETATRNGHTENSRDCSAIISKCYCYKIVATLWCIRILRRIRTFGGWKICAIIGFDMFFWFVFVLTVARNTVRVTSDQARIPR